MKMIQKKQGFTLIELLTVIAIIGILAGILIPTVGVVRQKANVATSKAQISQYLTALQSFKGEYGYYPFSSKLNNRGEFRLNEGSNSRDFYETLMARDLRNPSESVSGNGNRRRITFYTFQESEFYAGPDASKRNTIADAFGNNQIRIVFDTDGDGVVTVPDRDSPSNMTKEVRSGLTAYVIEDARERLPGYFLYE